MRTLPVLCMAAFTLVPSGMKAQAQPEPGATYDRRGNVSVTGILTPFDGGTASCSGTPAGVGGLAEVVFSHALTNGSYVVAVRANNRGDGMAVINSLYCVSSANLNTYFAPTTGPEFGLVTVPFKLRVDPLKIMAGNTIGPFVGKRFKHTNGTASTLMVFASLTNVPLNDVNAEVPETKWGVGLGAGYVWTIRGSFQAGLISGVDLFEGVEDWLYGYKPWLSLSIGYSFLSPVKDQETLARAR